MKKKILIIFIIISGICGIFWVNGNSRVDPKYIQKEIPVSSQQAEELKVLVSELVKTCRTSRYDKLKALFPYSMEERKLLEAENGVDPVEHSLNVLYKYGREFSLENIRYSSFENSSKLFFATGETNDGNSVKIQFRKYPEGYGILGITEL